MVSENLEEKIESSEEIKDSNFMSKYFVNVDVIIGILRGYTSRIGDWIVNRESDTREMSYSFYSEGYNVSGNFSIA